MWQEQIFNESENIFYDQRQGAWIEDHHSIKIKNNEDDIRKEKHVKWKHAIKYGFSKKFSINSSCYQGFNVLTFTPKKIVIAC